MGISLAWDLGPMVTLSAGGREPSHSIGDLNPGGMWWKVLDSLIWIPVSDLGHM